MAAILIPVSDIKKLKTWLAINEESISSTYNTGRKLTAEQAQQKGFQVLEESSLSYDPAKGFYSYAVKSDYDLGEFAIPQLWIDGNNGAFVAHLLPTGQKSGDTLTYWLQTLHMAKIWGLPYKIFVCLMGLVVAMSSVTGVYIWWKKRLSGQGNSPIRPGIPQRYSAFF